MIYIILVYVQDALGAQDMPGKNNFQDLVAIYEQRKFKFFIVASVFDKA